MFFGRSDAKAETPVLLPGKFHGRRTMGGYSPWGHKESDMTEQLHFLSFLSFKIDWFDLLSIQGTLKSLLQDHNSKVSILQHSAFFMVQLLHPYMTTGKIIGLIIQTFVGKVMLLNMLSRLVIAFLPRSKCLLISWLQSLSTVILEPKKIKSVPVFTFSP